MDSSKYSSFAISLTQKKLYANALMSAVRVAFYNSDSSNILLYACYLILVANMEKLLFSEDLPSWFY